MHIQKRKEEDSYEGIVIFAFDDGSYSTDESLPEMLSNYLNTFEKTEISKEGKTIQIPIHDHDKYLHYMVVGLGKKDDLEINCILEGTGAAVKIARNLKLKNLNFGVSKFKDLWIKTMTEGLIVSDYEFNIYKSDKTKHVFDTFTVDTDQIEALEEGIILGESVLIARHLVNEPANVMTPEKLAEEAISYGKTYGFEVEILDKEAIENLNMIAYLSVAKASENPPKFIIMRYMNAPESDEILGLVGKGLTFDTGGYSLKPKDSMLTMKSDMGGSAAVIGAMCALSSRKLKKNVIGVVAACENMISGGGYRPGDIIGSRGGKSIFINSTDAEGRLTLIDAVDYTIKDLKATKVVDIATLTGACLVALGNTTTGVVSNDDAFYKCLENVSVTSGERVWRMPIFPEYKKLLKHEDADLVNSTKLAGMITAGMFIGEFVGDVPWIHMDIAGTSWVNQKNQYQSYGGTGAGVKNLYYLAKEL
jgi:leucyl aminopeptidase